MRILGEFQTMRKKELCILSRAYLTSFRFRNQKSNTVYMKKGKYYYMEAIMKDDHQIDHLEVGLQTPSGKIFNVIPEQYLWTNRNVQKGRYTRIYVNLILVP